MTPTPGLLSLAEQDTFREWLNMVGHVGFQATDPAGEAVRLIVGFVFDRIDEQGMQLARLAGGPS